MPFEAREIGTPEIAEYFSSRVCFLEVSTKMPSPISTLLKPCVREPLTLAANAATKEIDVDWLRRAFGQDSLHILLKNLNLPGKFRELGLLVKNNPNHDCD